MKQLCLPSYVLDSNLVLLPGIIYNVTFSRFKAAALLSRFKSKVQIPLIKDLLDEYEFNNDDCLSKEAEQGILEFNELKGSDIKEFDWLTLAIKPNFDKIVNSTKTNVLTIVKIIGITEDNNNVRLTFQAISRGTKVKSHKNECILKVDDNKFTEAHIKQFKILDTKVKQLFQKIDQFLKDYSKSLNEKNSLLTLNPLATSLYLQLVLSNDFNKAYKSLKRLYDLVTFRDFENLTRIIDFTCAIMPFPALEKLDLLNKFDISDRLSKLNILTTKLIEVFGKLSDNNSFVDNWFFNEATNLQKASVVGNQLKSIRLILEDISEKHKMQSTHRLSGNQSGNGPKSLGIGSGQRNFSASDNDDDEDLKNIRDFINNILPNTTLGEDSKRLILKDYKRLQSSTSSNSDSHVLRNYLDIVSDFPFDKYVSKFASNLAIDITQAKRQLDLDHYGLENVKKRLVQYLVILKLLAQANDEQKVATKNKSPIIMLSGPPGIGKTSLAKSIAKTLGRNFQRISLGGVRDESELRGHRRTYVGAMPGVIVQSLRKAKSMNPVILLDEIDKVSGGNRAANKVNGDPSAALLEILDPEQNSSFVDHYLGFPIDLSQVIFICTANEPYNLSRPLLDRLEMIDLSAYDYHEKMVIARNYLLPRQITRNGLPESSLVDINDNILEKIITDYTREAGVRNLERKLGTICRNKAVEYAGSLDGDKAYDAKVNEFDLPRYLGAPLPNMALEIYDTPKQIGIVNGLSYNEEGSGSVLTFETIGFINTNGGSLNMTGRLGEVLMESGKIGLTFIKQLIHNNILQMNDKDHHNLIERHKNLEIHLHVPMGSISKDGPSAGITMALAFLSLILEKPVAKHIAMTGEITLRGLVLPIGGIKEKLLGAHLSGIKKMIVPRENRKDLIEEYIKAINDDTKLNALLKDNNNKHNFEMNDPESYYFSKYGITINYAVDFRDVIRLVWGDGLIKEPLKMIEYRL